MVERRTSSPIERRYPGSLDQSSTPERANEPLRVLWYLDWTSWVVTRIPSGRTSFGSLDWKQGKWRIVTHLCHVETLNTGQLTSSLSHQIDISRSIRGADQNLVSEHCLFGNSMKKKVEQQGEAIVMRPDKNSHRKLVSSRPQDVRRLVSYWWWMNTSIYYCLGSIWWLWIFKYEGFLQPQTIQQALWMSIVGLRLGVIVFFILPFSLPFSSHAH